jgi:FtsP/CotA-like multicopper oxidase with cupredoxin domain
MKDHHHHHPAPASGQFPTDPAGLPQDRPTEVVELADGATFALGISSVAKRLGGDTLRMLAYNGSIPGPTLRVPQGSEITVDVENHGEMETTVHWHGLRLDNRYDGTHETQAPIAVGGRFQYRLPFPDAGVYWYHPHLREDYAQELGLYGTIVVVPRDPGYWPPVHREVVVTLDDILVEDGRVAPFERSGPTHVAMGRFGNVLLVNGETCATLTVRRGEVARFFLVNTANTRIFNVTASHARMKLVGGDSGRYEREEFVDVVMLSPSERAVVDVMFDTPGLATLEHRTPERVEALVEVTVGDERAQPSLEDSFATQRTCAEMVAERRRVAPYLAAAPDKTVAFIAEMDVPAAEGAAVYACPMHPEVVSDHPDRCPKCGMKLMPQSDAKPSGHGHHDHEHGAGHGHGEGHGHGTSDRIEWEDDMVDVNRGTTPDNMRWKIVDRSTGAENHAIDWRFRVGDQV